MFNFESLAQVLGSAWRADLTWLTMKLPDGAVPSGDGRFVRDFEEYLNTNSLPFWEGGHGLPGSVPPGGWSELSLEGLARYTDRDGVLAELARRASPQPGQVWVFESVFPLTLRGRRYFTIASTPSGDVVGVGKEVGWNYGTNDRGATLRVFHATPHPEGWWTGRVAAGPEHYAALRLVEAQSGAGVNVFRALWLWERDQMTGQGRFKVHKDADSDGTLFVHLTFWGVLDAMALLYEAHILPYELACIPATVIRLGGKTQIVPLSQNSRPQVLAEVARKGPNYGYRDRVIPAPRTGCPAFVSHQDCWLPTHQEWSSILVALAEGDVLALMDGRGITLKEGKPYLVPGLARSPEHHVWDRAIAL